MSLLEELKLRSKRGLGKEKSVRAKTNWAKLRQITQSEPKEHLSALDLTSNEIGDNLVISHGVSPSIKVETHSNIKQIVHNVSSGQYIVLYNNGRIDIVLQDGKKELLISKESFVGLLYTQKSKQYIGWNKKNDIKVLKPSLQVLNSIPSNGKVNCMVYNEFTNEVVSAGLGVITVWVFRSNNQILIPKRSVTQNLSPTDEISILAIEQTSSKSQRCFAAVRNSVFVFRLRDGFCITQIQDMHRRDVTDVLFCQSIRVLLTGAEDGSIKIWDETWNLRSVFVGHTSAVTSLSTYQRGPLVISGSEDGTLRLWNVDTCDEIDKIETGMPVRGICKRFGKDSFYTFTDRTLQFWKINDVYNLFTVIGSKAKIVKTSTHPKIPLLAMYICEDSCIRIVCPKTGNIITVMMSPNFKRIKDAVFAIAEGLLFVLLWDGTIVKCSTSSNPCEIQELWTKEHPQGSGQCTCLCLYEYTVEDSGDIWKALVAKAQSQKHVEGTHRHTQMIVDESNAYDRTILLGGCSDGTLAVYEWQDFRKMGKITFSIEAHRGEIVAMAASPVINQVATSGKDHSIRIWQVFPFAEEALAPLMFFMDSELATHLSFSRRRLCVAFQEPSTATYNITILKPGDSDRDRLEHSTDVDHTDMITCICSCSKMKIFASGSIDGTIKIWNESNKLIRIIKLNSKPHSISFCSQRGDLLVGIGNHVHRIGHTAYMPEANMKRMVVMKFVELPGKNPIPVDEDVEAKLDVDHKNRLYKAHNSYFKKAQYVDEIPEDEVAERNREEEQKRKAYALLNLRDDDLKNIRDGVAEAEKRPPPPASVKEEAWNKYLDLFYKRPPRPTSDLDSENSDEEYCVPNQEEDTFQPERGQTGFFSVSSNLSDVAQMRKNLEEIENQKQQERQKLLGRKERTLSTTSSRRSSKQFTRPLSVGHCVEFQTEKPNAHLRRVQSAIVGPDFPELTINLLAYKKDNVSNKAIIDVSAAEDFPSSAQTIRQVNKRLTSSIEKTDRSVLHSNRKEHGMLPIAPDGYLPNSIVVALYKELKKKEEEEQQDDWKPKQLTGEQLAELEEFNKRKRKKTPIEEEEEVPNLERVRSSFYNKLQEIAESNGSSPVKEFNAEDFATPPPTPPKSPSPEPIPVDESSSKVIKPTRPIEKLISRPKSVKPDTPPLEPSPPPPPPTPLPQFITQFRNLRWFEKCFPNVDPHFTELISGPRWLLKSEKSLHGHMQEKTFPRPWTISSFVTILLGFLEKLEDYDLKTQICEAIMLLHRQDAFDPETSLIVQKVVLSQLNMPDGPTAEGSYNEKQFIKTCLTLLSILDVNSSLVVELMVQFILGETEIKEHVLTIFAQLNLQDPHGYFTKEMDNFTTYGVLEPYKKRRNLKTECSKWLDKWIELFQRHITSLAGKIYRARKGNVVRGTKSPKTPERIKGILKTGNGKIKAKDIGRMRDKNKATTVSFVAENFVDEAAKNITPVEAINYFCEIQYQEEIERARQATVVVQEEPEKPEKQRNTVLMLPKIDGYNSLVRLGETHKSVCHPERETSLAYDLRLPPICRARADELTQGLLLHLNTLTLNPFSNGEDELMYEPFANSKLITLRTAQKYFIPARSYAENIQ